MHIPRKSKWPKRRAFPEISVGWCLAVRDDYETLRVTQDEQVVVIALNRPEVHNAFNAQMIQDLTDAFESLTGTRRFVSSFCVERDDLSVPAQTRSG